MSNVAALREAIEKAGLIKPGKPHIVRRALTLLSTIRNDRKAKVLTYLERRKAGRGFGPKNKRGFYTRRRTGTYTGVYATGVNKSESGMDAIDLLHVEIEKAVSFRGVRMSPAQRRLVAGAGSNYKRVWREGGRSNFMQGGRRGKRVSVAGHQAKTTPSSVQRGIRARLRKSEQPMSDVTDDLYDAIEKARGMIPRGGSSRLARRIADQGARARAKGGDAKEVKRFHALGTLENRKRGNSIGLGYTPGKGYKSLRRTGRYK